MSELNRTGAYRLREDLRGALQEQFYAAFCDDTQTKEVIAGLWAKHRYLIDPHTAVAFEALNRYRRETGDTAKTLVVSTASPFKFCDSVLDALGVDASAQKSGLDLLDQLGTLAALTPPAPLAALRDKAVRFTGVVDKTEMRAFVRDALG
jgi:threonine synthase